MSPSAVASRFARSRDQVFLSVCFVCFAGGAVQLFTREADTFSSFSTSSSDFPAAIASLICLHDTLCFAVCLPKAGEPTSTAAASKINDIELVRFT